MLLYSQILPKIVKLLEGMIKKTYKNEETSTGRKAREKISYKPRLFKNARLSWKLLREGQPASPLAASIICQCQSTQTPQTLKIHPSKSLQRSPVFSTAHHEIKLSPQRGSFHHETIWFRNQADFSLLLEDKTILKKRNSA